MQTWYEYIYNSPEDYTITNKEITNLDFGNFDDLTQISKYIGLRFVGNNAYNISISTENSNILAVPIDQSPKSIVSIVDSELIVSELIVCDKQLIRFLGNLPNELNQDSTYTVSLTGATSFSLIDNLSQPVTFSGDMRSVDFQYTLLSQEIDISKYFDIQAGLESPVDILTTILDVADVVSNSNTEGYSAPFCLSKKRKAILVTPDFDNNILTTTDPNTLTLNDKVTFYPEVVSMYVTEILPNNVFKVGLEPTVTLVDISSVLSTGTTNFTYEFGSHACRGLRLIVQFDTAIIAPPLPN